MTAKQTYFILDKNTRFIGAHRLRPGQKTIDLTEAEAEFFLSGGALSLNDPDAPEPDPAPEPPAPEPVQEPAAVDEITTEVPAKGRQSGRGA